VIDHDDKLYKLLAEIGADYGLYVIHHNPLADPEVAMLYKWDLVEYKQTDMNEWHFTLTDRGRAWLEVANVAIEKGETT